MNYLKLLIFLITLGCAQSGLSQKHSCRFDHLHDSQNPASGISSEELEDHKRFMIQSRNQTSSRDALYNLPIVFHIIHSGEEVGRGPNLEDDRIFEQLDILNKDFDATNEDHYLIPPAFKDYASSTNIQFCMSKINPYQKVEQGITRHYYADIPDEDFIEDVIKPETIWDPSKYINVWILDMPISGVIGYAFLPTSSMVGSSKDGVVLNYKYVGNNGSSKGRTLVHEMGHYLGLYHLWGLNQSCDNDDNIEDTPPQDSPNFGCPSYPVIKCSASSMYMNFMDYTNDRCMHMFTREQAKLMQNIIKSKRPNLINNGSSICSQGSDCINLENTRVINSSEEFKDNWVVVDHNNDQNKWIIDSDSSNSSGIISYQASSDQSSNDYLFSPCIQIKANQEYEIEYFIEHTNSMENIRLGFSTDASSNTFYTPNSDFFISWIMENSGIKVKATFSFDLDINLRFGFHTEGDLDDDLITVNNIKLSRLQNTTPVVNHDFKDNMNLFPNPTVESVNLELPSHMSGTYDIEVYNIHGQTVMKNNNILIDNNNTTLNVSTLEKGWYILKVINENSILSNKFLKL